MKFPARIITLLLWSIVSPDLIYGQDIIFQLPLHGAPGKDFWIDYYVDHDRSEGIFDGHCGSKTYNGHTGTDFLLRSFKTMDSGVNVYAIADGYVLGYRDGLFDRRKKWIDGGLGNYVRIMHGEYVASYGHLMKNSLLVKVGDSVRSGQAIAKVGSSGYSAYPHLHLQLNDLNDRIIDPFKGGCNEPASFRWVPQVGYDTECYAIEYGFIPYIPQLDTLLDRYLVTDEFYLSRNSVVCLWGLMHGLRKDDKIRVDWYAPDGSRYYRLNHIWKNNWWYDYTWAYLLLPIQTGKWTANLFVNNKLRISKSFFVRD